MPKGQYERKDVAERLASKLVCDEGGCLVWTGTRLTKGHGQIRHNGKMKSTHRVAWEIAHGPIPAGLCVLHKCDNPPCCNPSHLFLGTNLDNIEDMRAKGRNPKGFMFSQTKLSEEDVTKIRQSVGVPQRVLSKTYGVSQSHVWRIRKHQTRTA